MRARLTQPGWVEKGRLGLDPFLRRPVISVARPQRHPHPRATMIVLETPRLALRHMEPHDLAALFALYRDPDVRRYFPDGTRTLAETKEELDWFRNGHPKFPELGLWATIERSSGAFLGRCGLLPWEIDGNHEVELAFLIDKARWGEGLATEAALAIAQYAERQLRLSRLTMGRRVNDRRDVWCSASPTRMATNTSSS